MHIVDRTNTTKGVITMSEVCPTVAVKADNDDGYMIINESDVTEDHVVIGGEAPAPKEVKPGSKDDLKAKCTEAEIEFADDATKADLQKLLDEKATNGGGE